jgi:cytochrome d ubiquinol oxidase subunit I
VISVNAWMQNPSGFRLVHGRAVDVHPLAALSGNSFLWNELIHMYIAAFIVTGFLLAAPYAIGCLRGKWGRYERTALAIPLTIAAIEGLAHTTRGAPEHLLGWYTNGQVKFGIAIPDMLSVPAAGSKIALSPATSKLLFSRLPCGLMS